jgi:hypothetical protein
VRQWSQCYGRLGQTTAGQSPGRAQHCQLATPPSLMSMTVQPGQGLVAATLNAGPHLPSKPRHRVGECYSEPRLALRELIRGLAEATSMPRDRSPSRSRWKSDPEYRLAAQRGQNTVNTAAPEYGNTLATTRPRCLAATALVG